MSGPAVEHWAVKTESENSARRPAAFAGIFGAAVGALALTGWIFHIDALQRGLPGPVGMKVPTAVAFLLAGASVAASAHARLRSRIAVVLSCLTVIIGLLSIASYVWASEARIPLLQPFAEPAQRMALATAINFALAGAGLIFVQRKIVFPGSQTPVLIAAFNALLILADYLFGGAEIRRFGPLTAMALTSAFAFSALCAGILLLEPERGLVLALRRPGPAGVIARRLLPAAVLVPLTLAWIQLEGRRGDLYGTEFGLAILTSSLIAVLAGVIVWSVGSQARAGSALAAQSELLARHRAELDRQAELVELSYDAIITMDGARVIRAWNRGAEEVYGWTAQEAIGQVIHDLLHTVSPVSVEDMDRTLNERGRWDGELVHQRRDGKTVIADSRQIRAGGGSPMILEINRDITASRALEAQLRQAQKLEAVGQLAGGIAHDFNNVLTVIRGYAELLLIQAGLRVEWREQVEEIVSASKRAAGISRQLLVFSRKDTTPRRNVAVYHAVESMRTLLLRAAGENVRLEFAHDASAGVVQINPSHLEQVLLNLVLNARDAMPKGGSIGIRTGQMVVDKEFSAAHLGVAEGIYAVISVSDTGIGMTPEVKARIFEPFFTTKEAGKGTGLGLATTYGIVSEAKGAILVYSELGIGTTFRILLPVSGASPDSDTPEEELDDLRGDETILVVEDEKPLQGYIRHVLEHFGYTVLLANDGLEAIHIVESKPREINLVLSDMAMPKQSGIQLGSELARIAPDLPILYMSGYVDRFRDIDRDSLIQKPFTPAALLTRVRWTLEPRAEPI